MLRAYDQGMVLQAILIHTAQSNSNEGSSDAFPDQALQGCLRLLEDSEPRVRLAVGECLGLMAQQRGPSVWEVSKDTILTSIEGSWVSACQPSVQILEICQNLGTLDQR